MMKNYVDSLPPSFMEKYESKSVPWGELGYATYKRTYARQLASGGTEEWLQTVARCVNSVLQIGKFTVEESMFLYDSVFNLKCSFSGRGLWQLGTPTMKRFGGDSLMNCWCLSLNDPVKPFCFAFNELMLGGGVGFNLQKENVYEMPPVKYDVAIVRRDEKDVDYIVPDNREGWIELLRRTLEAFFVTGKSFSFSTICIRPKGARIKGFGGVASGPEDLCQGIEQIAGVLSSRHGKKLRPIDCLDVMNIIGSIVVSGNVRRSAQLALGDPDDYQFLSAKDWSKHKLPPWRNMSNNSVACNFYEHLTDSFWKGYGGEGESYGLINLKNFRTHGRLADGVGYRPDPKIVGTNPCGEIGLSSGESCNLCEIFLPRISDASEFIRISEIMYKVVKSISCLPMIYPETNEIVKQNHRLGISVTGFLQSKYIKNDKFFTDAYKNIEKADAEYSRVLGVNKSIKLTTVKPSGCRPWYALTTTTDGILTLEEMFQDHPEKATWAGYKGSARVIQDHGSSRISRTFSNGESDLVSIKMAYNIEVESTPDHPWWVKSKYVRSLGKRIVKVGEWVPAKNIKPEDILDIRPGVYSKHEHAKLSKLDSMALKMRGGVASIL